MFGSLTTYYKNPSNGGNVDFGDRLIRKPNEHVHLADEANNPCIKDILAKLQRKDMQRLTVPDIGGLQGTGHLSQGILDLFDGMDDIDLTFKVAEAGTDASGNPRNASTQKRNKANEWIVTLDDDYVRNATKLSIARTIIHESVHAYIGYNLKLDRTSEMATDFSAYRLYLLSNPKNRYKQSELDNLTEHNFISQYVEALANSLAVWDNRSQNIGYYKKLSWAGLESSNAYKSQKNKTDIQNAIFNERTASNKAKGFKCP